MKPAILVLFRKSSVMFKKLSKKDSLRPTMGNCWIYINVSNYVLPNKLKQFN